MTKNTYLQTYIRSLPKPEGVILPFLKNKNDAGIAGSIIKNREPDKPQEEPEYSLEDCAHDILAAIKIDDAGALADALKELVKKVDKEPHEEGPHKPSPHTYESSKED